jgi:hypothetical protein
LKSVSDQGLAVSVNYGDTVVAADRQFESKLRESANQFANSPGTDLELLVNYQDELSIGPLRLQVTAMKPRYGRQEFVGKLVANSELVPELRQGLPVAVGPEQVHAWQLNSDPPVLRSQ